MVPQSAILIDKQWHAKEIAKASPRPCNSFVFISNPRGITRRAISLIGIISQIVTLGHVSVYNSRVEKEAV